MESIRRLSVKSQCRLGELRVEINQLGEVDVFVDGAAHLSKTAALKFFKEVFAVLRDDRREE